MAATSYRKNAKEVVCFDNALFKWALFLLVNINFTEHLNAILD